MPLGDSEYSPISQQKEGMGLGVVAPAYNHSYLGGRGRRITF
jgi:hypothetical protein